MISAIRYPVEIQLPSSSEAPSVPWMSASEELVIWMSRIAMKAPSIAPMTASQLRSGTVRLAGAAPPSASVVPLIAR